MLKKERAFFAQTVLNRLYKTIPIPLDHSDNYTLLVAVLLSAQCTDIRVNQVTPALFKLASNAKKMATKKPEQLYPIIKPCGLAPRKSRAIVELSQILMDKYNGEVPENMALLEELPGVGHKTASVVMSQGFGHPAFPVDTHIHRLAQRWGLTNGKNVVQTERDLKKLYSKEDWNKLHLQIIFYGREFCSARGCDGTVCEICTGCYPKRKKAFLAKKP